MLDFTLEKVTVECAYRIEHVVRTGAIKSVGTVEGEGF
jgi:hypothetical protein